MKLIKRVARVEAAAAAAADAALVFSVDDCPLSAPLAEGEHLAVDLGVRLVGSRRVKTSVERASRIEGDFGVVTDESGAVIGHVNEILDTAGGRLIYWGSPRAASG